VTNEDDRQPMSMGLMLTTLRQMWLPVLVMLLCTVQYFGQFQLAPLNQKWLEFPASINYLATTAEYWRLITPIFIHYDIVHLGANLLVFWVFAGAVWQYQRRVFVLLLPLAALASHCLEFVVVDHRFGGLSGVCFAYFGFMVAYQWLIPNGRLFVTKPTMLVGFGFLLASGTPWLGAYAFYVHLGGCVVGMLAGLYYARIDRKVEV